MGKLFKVGQKVTIKRKMKSEEFVDYPYSYTKDMEQYAGRKAIITRAYLTRVSHANCKFYNLYDQYVYKIDLDGGEYIWSSPMFQETYEL